MAGRKLQICIIGTGNVGTTLALALRRRGHSIVAVISKKKSSAKRCAKLVGCKNYSTHILSLPHKSDFILMALPDDCVQTVARQLSRLNIDYRRTYVAHTSGVHSSEALRQVREAGASVFSFHPMQTFSRIAPIEARLASLSGIRFGFEGDKSSKGFASRIARDLRGRLMPIPKEAKILYHLACVFASNFTVSLLGAVEMIGSAFLKKQDFRGFKKLVETSVENAFAVTPTKALTGPIVRGDLDTIRLHVRELKKKQKDLLPLYRELGLLALRIANSRKSREPETTKLIRKVLRERSIVRLFRKGS
ncbi:MAG: Rossmann-like and DUF2520 domain-containing protein [Bacteroidota bacterium]